MQGLRGDVPREFNSAVLGVASKGLQVYMGFHRDLQGWGLGRRALDFPNSGILFWEFLYQR